MTDDELARIITQRDIAIEHRDQLKIEVVRTSAHIRRLEKLQARAENFELQRAEAIVMTIQRSLTDPNATLKTAVRLAYEKAGARDKEAIQRAFGQMVLQNAFAESTALDQTSLSEAFSDSRLHTAE